jgi:hypothetical protein
MVFSCSKEGVERENCQKFALRLMKCREKEGAASHFPYFPRPVDALFTNPCRITHIMRLYGARKFGHLLDLSNFLRKIANVEHTNKRRA